MSETGMKVGELARRTGLSVRTLHHYDAVGLLRPATRTPAGHRLYSVRDVRRLQHIASLKHLGLSLEEIGSCLHDPDYALPRVLRIHLRRIREEIEKQLRLRGLLESLLERLNGGEEPSVDELTRAVEGIVDVERYYTPEQLERLARRREEIGDARMLDVQKEWAELFSDYEDAMASGVDPGDEKALALARRAEALVAEFTRGEADVEASLDRMYRAEGPGNVLSPQGMHVAPAVWAYMAEARRALQASRA